VIFIFGRRTLTRLCGLLSRRCRLRLSPLRRLLRGGLLLLSLLNLLNLLHPLRFFLLAANGFSIRLCSIALLRCLLLLGCCLLLLSCRLLLLGLLNPRGLLLLCTNRLGIGFPGAALLFDLLLLRLLSLCGLVLLRTSSLGIGFTSGALLFYLLLLRLLRPCRLFLLCANRSGVAFGGIALLLSLLFLRLLLLGLLSLCGLLLLRADRLCVGFGIAFRVGLRWLRWLSLLLRPRGLLLLGPNRSRAGFCCGCGGLLLNLWRGNLHGLPWLRGSYLGVCVAGFTMTSWRLLRRLRLLTASRLFLWDSCRFRAGFGRLLLWIDRLWRNLRSLFWLRGSYGR